MTVKHKKPATKESKAPTSAQSLKNVEPSLTQKKAKLAINLRNIPLLTQLTPNEINTVKDALHIRRYTRREIVAQKGTNCEHLLFLLSGKLQVIELTDEGRVIGLNLLSSGAFFGEVALINQSSFNASAIALSEALVAFLPGTTALHLFAHSPSVASQIQRHLAQKVQRDHKFRTLLSINNTAKRIFSFLVLMKRRTSEKQELVEHLPTHQEIANMINTSRETVTRTLLTLTHQGITRKDSHRLIIVNPTALKKLAQDA